MSKMKLIRVKTSYIWATVIAIAVIAWMVSGQITPTKSSADKNSKSKIASTELGEIQPITVNAIKVKNRITPLIVRASGVTETLFEIVIVARRKGLVAKINFSEGVWVETGDEIVELDRGTLESDLEAAQADRQAADAVYADTKKRYSENGKISVQLRSAKADLDSKKKTFEISKSLVKQGVQTELALSQKRALLRAAETRFFELKNLPKELELSDSYARLKSIDSTVLRLQEQLNFTKVKVPQHGWLEELNVEIGEFVDENKPIARLLGLQTLTLTIPIAQANIGKVSIGAEVDIDFGSMGTRKGKVGKIAATANKATRTFNVEITLDNTDAQLRAGMTAEAEVIIGEVRAVKISPAHLNVQDNGQLTVKIVNDKNRVKIVPVELVRTAGNFAFISGIEDGIILLTAGQAFLSTGELVKYSLINGNN
jgi:multidrug efflux system membrane fusion protein